MKKLSHFYKSRILFLVLAGLLTASFSLAETMADVSQLRSEIDRLEEQIQQLQKEQEQYKNNIFGAQAKAQTLQNQINSLNNQIKYLESQIKVTTVSINKTSVEINETQGDIQTAEQKIEAQKRTIGQTLLFLDRQDKEGLLVTLLKNDSMSDFFRQVQYANSLSEGLTDLVRELEGAKKELESEKNQLETKKEDLIVLKQRQASERAAVSGTKAETSNLLKATKGQEAEFQKMLTKSEELERQMNLEIFKLEDQLRKAIDPNSLPLARPGVLSAPVQGRISQGYGCLETRWARRYYPDCNNGKGGFHNGLDIAASYGTPLRAADDGTVIAIGNAPYAYGTWAAVEHSNGLVTAYTHMSIRSVSVGQQLRRGNVVGSMGSSGLSTGSHIHFMVYAPRTFTTKTSSISGVLPIGATLNPLDYLLI